ncbi:hypothetical protein HMPREF3038_01553 [Akkermansia sp. KLE1797]|nr:hypothetical protein HMPREF3038_01553 [Akkermansia sp. KLE1797]KXU54042.1 hypothetical protein HMPREF3039_01707 [Akkermansia sp. KLE1798]
MRVRGTIRQNLLRANGQEQEPSTPFPLFPSRADRHAADSLI